MDKGSEACGCVCWGGSEIQKTETEGGSQKYQGRMSRKAGAKSVDSIPDKRGGRGWWLLRKDTTRAGPGMIT